MNIEKDKTTAAAKARPVKPAPKDPKSPAQFPNPNFWLIIRRDEIPESLAPLYEARHLPKRQWLSLAETVVTALGTPFSQPAPFAALRMQPTPNGLPLGIALHESLDWIVAEATAEAIRTASLDEVPPAVIQAACSWAMPQLMENLKLSVRVTVEDAAADAIRDAQLTPRPSPAEILAERRQVFAGSHLAPLPPAEREVVVALIEAATPIARRYRLNPHQLFCDGRIANLIPHDPALFAFERLPLARQANARAWLASALGWGTIYPEPDRTPPSAAPAAQEGEAV